MDSLHSPLPTPHSPFGAPRSPLPLSPAQLVAQLAQQVRQCETSRRKNTGEVVSTGIDLLDRWLPDGGLHRGTLVEWIASAAGCGAESLALAAARGACGEQGTLIVIDRQRSFYALSAVAHGIDLRRLIIVRPNSDADEAWAIDQALRSRGVRAVLAWPQRLEDHLFRRLQLAAEQGSTLGLLVRPPSARGEPSWAELRLLVAPLPTLETSIGNAPRRISLTMLRAPGRTHAANIVIQLGSATKSPRSKFDAQRIQPQRTPRAQRQKRRVA